MGNRITEPHVYSGFVIAMMGPNTGERVPMPFKVAQSNVSSGMARWEDDDETSIDKGVAGKLAAVEAEKVALTEADRLANEAAKNGRVKSVEQLLADRARPIHFFTNNDEDGTKRVNLGRPFPPVAIIDYSTLPGDLPQPDGLVYEHRMQGDDDRYVSITLPNARAIYKVIEEREEGRVLLLELTEADQFDEPIAADWRNRNHLFYIPIAKAIRRSDDSMKKDEAIAIIEEWTKADDQVRVDASREATPKGEGPDAGNRDQNPDGGDPAQKAVENEKAFAGGDDNLSGE